MKVHKFNKPLLLSLGILSVGSLIGGYFVIDKVTKPKADIPVQTEIEEGNNFKIKYAFNSTSDKYGCFEFTYKVTPDVYTDQILAKLTYTDNTEVDNTILKMEHLKTERKVKVHCLGVFTKQAQVKLYAESNVEVYCLVKLDFREKLTVTLPKTVTIEQGKKPTVEVDIQTTGGSKTVSKELENQTYNFNPKFLEWCRNQATSYVKTMTDEMKKNCDIKNVVIGENVNLTQPKCAEIFTTNFDATTFLKTFGVNYSFDYHYSDDDDPDYSTDSGVWTLNKLNYAAFSAEFDGSQPIIDYTVNVNGVKYSQSLGIVLSKIPVKAITASPFEYTF